MALAALLISLALAAQPPLERTAWALTINEVEHGDLVAALDAGGVWVPVAALEEAGLRVPNGRIEVLFGERHALLDSLAPAITYHLDTDAIRIDITADPALLAETRVNVLPVMHGPAIITRAPSVQLNYSVNWQTSDKVSSTTGSGELILSGLGAVAVSGFSVDADSRVTRGLSSMTVDQVGAMRRWALGDTYGASTQLGSRPVVLGLSVGREYSLDPYFQRFGLPAVTGSATVPSRAEIYVNGSLVRDVTLPPGPFRVDRLPVSTGLGNVEVVIVDPFGRRSSYGGSFYLGQSALRCGEQEYSYVTGAKRVDESDGRVRYERMMASGVHRIGVTNWLTLGVQGEGEKGVWAAGGSFAFKPWRLGELTGASLVSRQENGTIGHAYTASYVFTARLVGFSANATYYDDRYASIDRPAGTPGDVDWRSQIDVPLGSPLRLSVGAFRDRAQVPFGVTQTYAPLTLSSAGLDSASSGSGQRGAFITATLGITSRIQLTATGQQRRDPTTGVTTVEALAGLTVTLGTRASARVEYDASDADHSWITSLDRSLPLGPGYGFRATTNSNQKSASALLEGQNGLGYASLRYEDVGGTASAGIDLAGSLSLVGWHPMLSRPVDASFAVARVPGVGGVHVRLNNQDAGRTNRWGDLMLPEVLPYLDNVVSVAAEDLPFDYAIDRVDARVIAPFRAGTLVPFRALVVRGLIGRVVVVRAAGETAPAFGTLTVTVGGEAHESPLSETGEFYLDGVPQGRYPAVVQYADGRCELDLVVPATTAVITTLGILRCVVHEP